VPNIAPKTLKKLKRAYQGDQDAQSPYMLFLLWSEGIIPPDGVDHKTWSIETTAKLLNGQ
jgi:hypothetical protein